MTSTSGPGQPIVVVGAGLAGLAGATTLHRAGHEVLVLEAAAEVGGRCRTDRVNGFLLDHGFQLLNPAYPAARELLDLRALKLQSFDAGVVVAGPAGIRILADPIRAPRYALGALRAPGSLAEKVAFARWAARVSLTSARRLASAPDEPLAQALDRWGLTGELRAAVLNPFLTGVLADGELHSSRRFVDLLVRSFVRGRPALPAAGIAAMPEQLAAQLPAGALSLNTTVTAVTGTSVRTVDGGSVSKDSASPGRVIPAAAVVLAADPGTASTLTGLPEVPMGALTTFYYRSEAPPSPLLLLHLDGARRGPVLNTAVISTIAPSYASSGALIQATILGTDLSQESAVRRQLALIYQVPTQDWDLIASYPIARALPTVAPHQKLRQPVDLGGGLFLAGDHRDTSSIQGALVSGRRAARSVLDFLHRGAL